MSLSGHALLSGVGVTGEGRANRFMLVLLAMHRIASLLPAVASCLSGVYHSPMVNLVLLAGAVIWNVVLFRDAFSRGWFAPVLVVLDLLVSVVVLVVVTVNLSVPAPNWGNAIVQAGGSLVAAALPRPLLAVIGVLVLVAAQAAVVVVFDEGRTNQTLDLVFAVNRVVSFALVGGIGLRYLRRQGRILDLVNAQRSATEAERAAEHARYVTRVAHHRALHDTVLATLTLIARGVLDHQDPGVRQRCARDADFVRGLLSEPAVSPFGTVLEALREVTAGICLLGLRVRYRAERIPPDVPQSVVDAVRDAAREALNNVVKHAGVDEAWLTATWDAGVLRVTVVDRGRGFAVDSIAPGFGFCNSVVERITEVGGRVRISSAPNEGTCVELTWSR